MSDKQQRLAYSIIDFLNQAIQERTVTVPHFETLQVAIEYIGEAFGINPFDEAQSLKLSVKPASLQSIFDVYHQTRDLQVPSAPAPVLQVEASFVSSTEPTSSDSENILKSTQPSTNDKVEAEQFRQTGNALVTTKDYDAAIQSYTTAIALDPTNPIYYSDRAAAHSYKGDHLPAMSDAEIAISVDPNFAKAYHRLGHALYSYGSLIFKASASAFERGLRVDPADENLKSGLQTVRTKMTDNYVGGMPDLSNTDIPQLMASGQQMAESFLRNSAVTLTNMVNDLRNLAH